MSTAGSAAGAEMVAVFAFIAAVTSVCPSWQDGLVDWLRLPRERERVCVVDNLCSSLEASLQRSCSILRVREWAKVIEMCYAVDGG